MNSLNDNVSSQQVLIKPPSVGNGMNAFIKVLAGLIVILLVSGVGYIVYKKDGSLVYIALEKPFHCKDLVSNKEFESITGKKAIDYILEEDRSLDYPDGQLHLGNNEINCFYVNKQVLTDAGKDRWVSYDLVKYSEYGYVLSWDSSEGSMENAFNKDKTEYLDYKTPRTNDITEETAANVDNMVRDNLKPKDIQGIGASAYWNNNLLLGSNLIMLTQDKKYVLNIFWLPDNNAVSFDGLPSESQSILEIAKVIDKKLTIGHLPVQKEKPQTKRVNVTFKRNLDDDPSKPAELVLSGNVYTDEELVYPISKNKASMLTIEDAMQSVFSAAYLFDEEWILGNFTPEEGGEMKDYILGELDYGYNTVVDYFTKSPYYALKYDLEYTKPGYHIVIIQTPTLSDVNPKLTPFFFKQTPDGWKQTTDISDYDLLTLLDSMSGEFGGEIIENN